MHSISIVGLLGLMSVFGQADKPSAKPAPKVASVNGNAVIRGKFGKSEIVITTTDRLAGAIHSLTWNGKEFIDSADHGRQLQSASAFDCAKPGEFWSEAYNPTEAGSRDDGAGDKSSSKLLKIHAKGGELQTVTQMAFWLAPGEDSGGRPALNPTILSPFLLDKRVKIGYKNLPNVLDYTVTFNVPQGEKHHFAQFEALTGYMPPDFAKFWKFEPQTGKLELLDDGPGEQAQPVVLATVDGAFAMGIFSPYEPSPGFAGAGYGRFRFIPEKVVKWNCVFRERNVQEIKPGARRFRMFVAVGTLEDVRTALISLTKTGTH